MRVSGSLVKFQLHCIEPHFEHRLRALDLLSGMVSKKNLMEIVKKLMTHMSKAEGTTYRLDAAESSFYQNSHFALRDELLSKIIQICSQNDYQYISNFEWFVQSQHGTLKSSAFSGMCQCWWS